MLIKSADDPQPRIEALTALLARPDVRPSVRHEIEQEIRNVRAGAAGERDAAYEIDFHLRDSHNHAVLHDLRMEIDGRVAQIDHLVIGRVMDVWVIESKHFADGVGVNEFGEWTAYYGRQRRGIPSPIEQNKKHMAVLQDAFAAGVELPKRLGVVSVRPTWHNLVLVSDNARISRPKGRDAQARIDGLERVVKVEQFLSAMYRDYERGSTLRIANMISSDTVGRIARELAALHRPAPFDPAARFGLPERPTISAGRSAGPPIEPSRTGKMICARCLERVSPRVVNFCWANAERFHDAIYCFECQKLHPAPSTLPASRPFA